MFYTFLGYFFFVNYISIENTRKKDIKNQSKEKVFRISKI